MEKTADKTKKATRGIQMEIRKKTRAGEDANRRRTRMCRSVENRWRDAHDPGEMYG